jgi:hypothetical protein
MEIVKIVYFQFCSCKCIIFFKDNYILPIQQVGKMKLFQFFILDINLKHKVFLCVCYVLDDNFFLKKK